jgi:DinB superfamily
MKQLIFLAIICLIAPTVAMAQDSEANPLSATARETFDQYAKNLVATAEEMPAAKYDYHPTPEQMTFGKTIEHVAEVNNFACAKASDLPAPQGPKATEADGKEKLVAGLKASMDFCAKAFSTLTDTKLAEPVTIFGGRRTTRLGAALEVTDDLIDHYAALAVYLRLNELLPPTAQKKP